MRGLLSRVGEPHRVATPGVAKYLIGEVAERSKALDWNSSNISTGVRGFESHPLRHSLYHLPSRGGVWTRPGWLPARCGMSSMQARMNTAMIAEARGRLTLRPPSAIGLSKKSPKVAPSGRVRMNAVQNSTTCEI